MGGMKVFHVFLKVLFGISCFLISSSRLNAQFAYSKPENILRPTGQNKITVNLSGSIPTGGIFSNNYSWTVSPTTGVSIIQPSASEATATAVFTSAASGVYTFTLSRNNQTAEVLVTVGNIAAASNSGLDISVFNVVNGNLASGSAPSYMFDPFPDVTTTAALGVTLNGYYYFMPNLFNNGNVTLYGASPDGLFIAPVASIDLNGISNNNLGFVRLAMDPTGKGWILAGDGITLYLASFVADGLNNFAINIVDNNVDLTGGTASVFMNGDLCFSGTGNIFALANNGSGITQIFVGAPNGNATTLTKKWDLVDPNGSGFTGNVNGVAFDLFGSLYISTGGASGGLYYIDQNTVNSATGTVQCSLVWAGAGLTDLASNFFPTQSTLPLHLISLSGNYQNLKTTLEWETENEQNADHFEVQRSSDGVNFSTVVVVPARNNFSRNKYSTIDDLSSVSGNTFTYRLNMVDKDGRQRYSQVVLVRKEVSLIKDLIVSPNPLTGGNVTLRFGLSENSIATIKIIDLSGKIVWRRAQNFSVGNNSVVLNGSEFLSKGIYIVQLTADYTNFLTKFVILQ